MAEINRLNINLIRLYGENMSRAMVDTNIPETLQEERMSSYHLMRSWKDVTSGR
jgi:hypothetical protein